MSEDFEAQLIAEQLRHTIDLLRAELKGVEGDLAHLQEMAYHRLEQLEHLQTDHETRIRSLQEGATQFKVWSGVASGGSSLMSVAALIKAWFSG